MSNPISWYAERYTEMFGMVLVPIEPMRKFPTAENWGESAIDNPVSAYSFWSTSPDWNMGLALGPSGFCSLDIDCEESFRVIMDEYGIPIEELDQYPTIQGASKGRRVMFRVPAGADLPYTKLTWPRQDDPKKRYTVLELRAATDGKQRQDVLPPSIHPDTGKPYRWITQPPATLAEWPTPPGWLIAIWEAWDKFKPQLTDACPWAEKPEPVSQPTVQRDSAGGDVIGAYVSANDLTATLAQYGYVKRGKRWLSPHSTTKLPGVTVFPDGRSCWIHHASDPLCSDDTGRPVNAFDLFCYYDHGGDVSRAVKAAADALGLKPERRPPPAAPVRADAPPPAVLSADIYTPLPHCNDKGKPFKHIDNLAEICRRLSVTVRYNVIKKEEEILIPSKSFSVDNKANASYAWLASECSLFSFGTDMLGDFLTYLSDQNLYNPVAEWITSRPWDGVPRMQALFDTVTTSGCNALKETLMRRWMVSACAAAFNPNGVSAHGVLTFQGDQYVGKTKWFKSLIPADLGLLKDGMLLRPEDKDSVKQICSFWLVELGELDATFRKSDIAALKSFITNDSDVLRRAYARKESHFARRTVFFASVNPHRFLHDPTGNRRFWTVPVTKLEHSHDIDMQQCWAEAAELYRAGESHYLTASEIDQLNEQNSDFTALDPIEEMIMSRLAWDDPVASWRWITATDVLKELGNERPSGSDATRAAGIIRGKNGGASKRANGKNLLSCPRLV